MLQMSSALLFIAFVGYLIATLLFGGAVRGKGQQTTSHMRFSKWASIVTVISFIANIGYFIARWTYTGHAPVSNMFEFTTAFAMFIVAAFIVLYRTYEMPTLGLIALPVAIIIIAYANMFPSEVAPLIPALKSHWLTIHVLTTVLGEAILAISAFSGLIYLLKTVDTTKRSLERFFLACIMYALIVVIGFIGVTTYFNATNYEASFTYVDKDQQQAEMTYNMPPIFGMHQYEAQTAAMTPLAEMPAWINAKKLTTVAWSLIVGTILYALIRVMLRKPIARVMQPLLKRAPLPLLDELSYRSVLVGFPVFTLGALIFAMIWAQEAWSRMWGWDPKEVWALITWLYYAAFLHMRMSRGFTGKKSAWLAVIGFAIIMFNLIAVNLIIAGLHSYAE
jgi:cytochrome c-type biogenesis protein CcsB